MYSVASIKPCEFRTTGCFDVPLNQSIELIFGLSSKQTIFGMGDLPRVYAGRSGSIQSGNLLVRVYCAEKVQEVGRAAATQLLRINNSGNFAIFTAICRVTSFTIL
jgi:hypothetical protein